MRHFIGPVLIVVVKIIFVDIKHHNLEFRPVTPKICNGQSHPYRINPKSALNVLQEIKKKDSQHNETRLRVTKLLVWLCTSSLGTHLVPLEPLLDAWRKLGPSKHVKAH